MQTIELSGPGKNALSTALMERTLGALREAKGEPILLTGAGDAFCAGLDIKEVADADVAQLGSFLGVLEDLVHALYTYPGPTVAYVNGHAIAGGAVMTLCCDVRVTTSNERARIGLNEVALGLRFPPRTLAMCRARMTAPALERVLLEAGLYAPLEAKERGFVDVVSDLDDAKARLARLASHPRDAYAEAKRVLRGNLDVPESEQRRFTAEVIPMWCSPEQKARIRAVLAK